MKAENQNLEFATLLKLVALPAEPPPRIMLMPWGKVETTKGTFLVDEESVRMVVEAFTAHGVDVPIDLEHATEGGEHTPPDGAAPAMGWIKRLGGDRHVGLMADVEWTPRGAGYVQSREYRYLSPAIHARKSDKRVAVLTSAALTNKPAIIGARPIVNKDEPTGSEENIMDDLKKVLAPFCELVGIAETADPTVVISALKSRIAPATPKLSPAICKALGVPEDATDAVILAAGEKLRQTDPTKFVPVEQVVALKSQVEALAAKDLDREAKEFIADGVAKGKINVHDPVHVEMWMGVFKADPKTAPQKLEKALAVVPADGRIAANRGPADGGTGDRAAVITLACREWAGDKDLQRLSNRAAHVAGELRDAGLDPALTEDEKKHVV